MEKKYAVGADIGGSHISTVLVDIETGTMLAESMAEQKIDNQAPAAEILDGWTAAIQRTMSHITLHQLAGIGLAMPGPFDYAHGVGLFKNVVKFESLYGINVGDELKKRLHLSADMPVRYSNDAMSFAIGECWTGQASAYQNVVAITLGTGFGSAFLTSGVPIIEGERVPAMGYVYNIPYESGIADDYFSTRWFEFEYKTRFGKTCEGVKEIADSAKTDAQAQQLFADFGNNLGAFMIPLLKNFQADYLFIGGNISRAYPLFGPAFEGALQKHAIAINIGRSDLTEQAAMAGSARLLHPDFWLKMQPLLSKI
uniref:ROK family protein n=1 Tax=Roseihalotalea indica TaxID=2867963 RepID=A0AA49GQV8_9BACT|nr:ROK family protein [Tunicatimonas sp. TK19036]